MKEREGQERVIEGGEKSIWYVLSLKQNPGLNMHTAREKKGGADCLGQRHGPAGGGRGGGKYISKVQQHTQTHYLLGLLK